MWIQTILAKFVLWMYENMRHSASGLAEQTYAANFESNLVGLWSNREDFGPLLYVELVFRADGTGTRTQGTAIYESGEVFLWREHGKHAIEICVLPEEQEVVWELTTYFFLVDRSGQVTMQFDDAPEHWFQADNHYYLCSSR